MLVQEMIGQGFAISFTSLAAHKNLLYQGQRKNLMELRTTKSYVLGVGKGIYTK